MPMEIQTTEVEREIFERELDSFVPDRLLDAHAHMWLSSPTEAITHDEIRPWMAEDMTLAEYRRHMDVLIPGRTFGGIILVVPPGHLGQLPATQERVGRLAEHIAKEVGSDPLCRSTMFVSPKIDPDFVLQEVQRLNIGGLKCYQTESPREQWRDSDIPEFLPEEFVRIADDLGLSLTLHMAKARGISDPSNQEWIRTHCEKYPNMKLILANTANSFNPVWAMEGIESLKGLAQRVLRHGCDRGGRQCRGDHRAPWTRPAAVGDRLPHLALARQLRRIWEPVGLDRARHLLGKEERHVCTPRARGAQGHQTGCIPPAS